MMSVKLSAAALGRLPKGVAAPGYDRADLSAGNCSHRRRQFPPRASGGLSRRSVRLWARSRLGDHRRRRARIRHRHARQARRPGLPDDGRRAGGERDDGPGDRADDRLRQAVRRRGDARQCCRGPSIRIVSLTVTEGGYCIDPATQKFDPRHPGDRLRRGAFRRAEVGLRPDRRRPQAPPRGGRRAVHRHVVRQHSRQRPRLRERGRRPRRAGRPRARRLDPRSMSRSPIRWSTASRRRPATASARS